MNSQDNGGKGVPGRPAGKNIPAGSEAKIQRTRKYKDRYKSRKCKRRVRLCWKKGTAHARGAVKGCQKATEEVPSDGVEKDALQLETNTPAASGKETCSENTAEDNGSEFSGEDIKEAKCYDHEQRVNNIESEKSEDPSKEQKEKPVTMDISSQSGDQKNKLLEMMSREFNSASIPEGSISLESRKSPRVPRMKRKRKSEVINTPEKTAENTGSGQPGVVATVSPSVNNPITSALKKIRKESLETPSLPTSPTTPGRKRRKTQERKSGSEKDSGEETTGITESTEVAEPKTEEVLPKKRATPDTRGRKRAREKSRCVIEGEEGNDSDNESPVIPAKGRGKTRSSSEEDFHAANSDTPGRGRGKSLKATADTEATGGVVGQIRGKGKLIVKEEPNIDIKGRGKLKVDGEKAEDPVTSILTGGKCQTKLKPPCEDAGNVISIVNSSAITMSTRSRGKSEPEKEGTLETESAGQPRRSVTPVSGESTPQSELKRSQRILLSREGSSDTPPACKRGIQKATPEVIKKPDIIATPPVKPTPTKPRREEIAFTKTGKKKKKHFKGLSYSFITRKKKGKTKAGLGRHCLDTSQESDSVVSEEIDMESVDSSSQDVPSEQLCGQDQDGIEDRLSDGGENDVEMDNVETPDLVVDEDALKETTPEKVTRDLPDSDKRAESQEMIEEEAAEKETDSSFDKTDKDIESELLDETIDDIETDNKEESKLDDSVKENEEDLEESVEKSDASTTLEDAEKVENNDPPEDTEMDTLKTENAEDQLKAQGDQDTEVKQDEETEVKQDEETEVKQDDDTEVKQDEETEMKQDEETEVKQDEETEVKQDEDTEVMKQDEGTEVKQDEGTEVKQDEDTEVIKQDEDTEMKQDDDTEMKQDEDTEVKQDEGIEVKQDKDTEMKQDEGTEVKQDKDTQMMQEEDTEVKQDEGIEVKQDEDTEMKQDEGTEVKQDEYKLNESKGLGKGLRTRKPPAVFSSPNKEVKKTVTQKATSDKQPSLSPSKVFSTPEMNCSASESAFSPRAEVEVHVPEEDGEALKKRPEEAGGHSSGAEGMTLKDNKPEDSVQLPAPASRSQVMEVKEPSCHISKLPVPLPEEGIRLTSRRRQSITKKKMEDYVPEGHNSDSSDSLGDLRLTGEGVRKSKRLSRHTSPHGFMFAAPESPEGPGRNQSKPVSSQSAYVPPASPGCSHHCYSLSTPVTLTHRCQQEANVQSAAPTLTNVLCKCRIKHNPLAVVSTEEVYCQAIDSFDGRMIGCCNIVTNYRLLRVSGKIPFMLLCDNHRRRLRRHDCCPCCGLFCTQGIFYECSWDKGRLRHYYHKLCSLVLNGANLCPHCGSSEPPQEVQLELMLTRKPVVYLKQHQERKESSARMTWFKKDTGEGDEEKDAALEVEPSLELENGSVISAQKLPIGCGREMLQEAIRYINEGKSVATKPSNKGIYLACKQNDVEKLLHALVSGLSPNIKVKDCSSQTGLHVAAAYGSVDALHILVMAGATIDMTDNQLMTPIMIAITKEQNNVVHYLVQAGASLMAKTQDGMTGLHLAAKCGNLTACRHILESGRLTRHAINMQDEGGWTPLVWASENRFIDVVKFLLDRGGNPQLCDVEQNTALHWAAFSGSTEICSMVLDRGCSLRSMNAHGDTPLHIASRQNHTDAVVLLVTRGAQLEVLNSKNQTPVNCALPDSDVYLQLTLNCKVLEIMKQNNIRTEKILSSDIAGGKEEVPIPCVNGVDEDLLPKDYLYIAENCEASNVTIDRTITSLKWCQCEDGCNAEHCGCGQLNFQCWFDPDGRLLPEFNFADPPMIFECNRACQCNKLSCNNRVVQHGISAHMQLFKTIGKGWGVRALKTIQKGSYVCEYVGEIITDLEADQRHDDSYLFDLDNRDSETFCIDARSYGNIARFINHLCEANLTPVKVFIDHQDLTFPRIALFANRDIEADEELGFDYGEKFWMIKYKHFTCTCSSEKCKYSSETIHTTLENYNKRLRELQGSV